MVEIKWLGQSAFKIKSKGKTIYIDPFSIVCDDTADIILITHGHFDHCSTDDIEKINGPKTVIVCPGDCEQKIMGNIKIIRPFEKLEINGINIEAIPAYNISKQFHPKVNGWVGYILTAEGKRIYHAGDTDLIPEMKKLENIDYAFLPVGGTYTMNASEAAEAARLIKPKFCIPMHYGSVVGSEKDAEKFRKICSEFTSVL